MKTTMQDLIVGHYEGALTPGQERELQALLATSPEARALYEQHGTIQEVMEEESERLAPPIALREATIGAALGVAAESISGGIAAWFTAKVAVAVGTVVVGGAAIGIVLSTTGDDEPRNSAPAVSAPAAVETRENGSSNADQSVSGEVNSEQNHSDASGTAARLNASNGRVEQSRATANGVEILPEEKRNAPHSPMDLDRGQEGPTDTLNRTIKGPDQ